MSDAGDREIAGLLSALAEAQDFPAAASFLLAELAERTGARKACLYRLESPLESLAPVATLGIHAERSDASVSAADLSSPLVLAALSLSPVRGTGALGPPPLQGIESWMAVPLPQRGGRGAPERMSRLRAVELAIARRVTLLPAEPRADSAPFAVVLLEHPSDDAVDLARHIALLAGPILARLSALAEAGHRESTLIEQRDHFKLMVDSLPDPVLVAKPGDAIGVHNERAARLFRPRDDDSPSRRRSLELNNLRLASFVSTSVIRGGHHTGHQAVTRELNLVDPDEGSDLLFQVFTHAMGERGGRDGAVLFVLHDVTDLRRAANELERQIQRVRRAELTVRGERDQLDLVLENVADPILVTDSRSNIVLMNEHAEHLFQIGDGDGQSPREIATVRGNDTKFTSFISEFALLDDDSRHGRMSLADPHTGGELPVEVVSGKVRNERREPIAIVSVLHDLTKQVENERLYDALKRLNSELEQRIRDATADLAEQNARLQWQSLEVERATKLKSEFLANMSHELRTPINALIGYTALLLDGVLGDMNGRQRDALTRGRAAAEHLLALINDILDLAKIEAGKMPMHVEDVPLPDLLAEVSQQIEPMVRKKHLEYIVDIASDCPPLYTDRTKVKQILLNLLSNAAKFTNRGRVSVEVRCAPGGVRMDVIDTGIGIRAADLQAIWDDFRQVDQSRTREFGGTGLGLSITRKLLERLGGSVTVQSTYGEGSKFSVYLPLVLPDPDASELTGAGAP